MSATLIASPLVFASPPQTWAGFYEEMKVVCVKVSGLKNPKPIGDIVGFDDRTGYSVLLMQGQYPQKHMRDKIGRELCLYSRRDKIAYASEADALISKGK
ncbi:hypothetical protein C5615_35775 [Burkholderia cepacia]|uniref:Uncharacterized protein n=1 Tax=Burkholderia cepacia TaxID=292 RepID=A0A2S8I2C6_BURCE|nr:hypothetical protein C5615_35775 [Burkholderia cepacia]